MLTCEHWNSIIKYFNKNIDYLLDIYHPIILTRKIVCSPSFSSSYLKYTNKILYEKKFRDEYKLKDIIKIPEVGNAIVRAMFACPSLYNEDNGDFKYIIERCFERIKMCIEPELERLFEFFRKFGILVIYRIIV